MRFSGTAPQSKTHCRSLHQVDLSIDHRSPLSALVSQSAIPSGIAPSCQAAAHSLNGSHALPKRVGGNATSASAIREASGSKGRKRSTVSTYRRAIDALATTGRYAACCLCRQATCLEPDSGAHLLKGSLSAFVTANAKGHVFARRNLAK